MQKIFLNIVLIHTIYSVQNVLPNDLQLKTFSDYQNNVQGIKLFQGITFDSMDVDFQILQLDLAYDKTLIGDTSKMNWGINCNLSVNTCEIIKRVFDQKTYMNSKFYADPSKSFFRFDNKDAINVDTKSQKMNFDLMNSAQKWPFGQYGVLGFAPNGDFAKYLRNTYSDQDITLYIQYKTNGQLQSQNLSYDLQVTMNPTQDIKGTVYQQKILSTEHPDFQAVLQTNDHNILKQYNFCLKSISKNIFNVKNSKAICSQLKKYVCEDIQNCTKNNSKMDKAVDLYFTVQDFNIKFKKSDYFFYDSQDNIQCRIGEFSSYEDGCSTNQNASIGKYFLTKYPIKIVYQMDDMTSYYIYKPEKVRNVPHIIFYLALLASLIALFFLIYQGCMKKKTEADNQLYVETKRRKPEITEQL